jgi:hypothetical protein
LELTGFHELFRAIFGRSGNLDYIFRIHAQQVRPFSPLNTIENISRVPTASQERSPQICDTLDTWKWEVKVLNIHDGTPGHVPSAWVAVQPPRRSIAAVRADLD